MQDQGTNRNLDEQSELPLVMPSGRKATSERGQVEAETHAQPSTAVARLPESRLEIGKTTLSRTSVDEDSVSHLRLFKGQIQQWSEVATPPFQGKTIAILRLGLTVGNQSPSSRKLASP